MSIVFNLFHCLHAPGHCLDVPWLWNVQIYISLIQICPSRMKYHPWIHHKSSARNQTFRTNVQIIFRAWILHWLDHMPYGFSSVRPVISWMNKFSGLGFIQMNNNSSLIKIFIKKKQVMLKCCPWVWLTILNLQILSCLFLFSFCDGFYGTLNTQQGGYMWPALWTWVR